MATVKCFVARVFTNAGKNGNLLGVVTDTAGLSDGQMQRIARTLGYSETSFVFFDTKKGDYRVRFFTPEKEIPFAGHPALGTLFVLRAAGSVKKKRGYVQVIGPRKVPLTVGSDGGIRMEQGKPSFSKGCSKTLAAAMIGVREADIAEEPMVVSTGLAHLLIPLRSPRMLAGSRILNSVYQSVRTSSGASCVMPFALDKGVVRCRMFAPALGIVEDPATGSGCGPLAAYVAALARVARNETELVVDVLQGGRKRSALRAWVRLSSGVPRSVAVGGHCVMERPRVVRL